jgi:hypothetical protein
MEFEGVPKLLDIPPRANVQLLVDTIPVWFGTVVRTGAPGSGRSWRYVALGGRHMLKYVYANYTYNDPNNPIDIATLAVNAWRTVQNPPLNPTMSTRTTGYTLTRLTAQWVDMHTLLSDLAKAAGDVPWGVDANGQIFFNKLTTSSHVSAGQVDIDPLPVDADDVWGTAILYHPQTGYAYRYIGDTRYGERVIAIPNLLDYMEVVQGTYTYQANQLYMLTASGEMAATSINPQLLQDKDATTGYKLYKDSAAAGTICSPQLLIAEVKFTPSSWRADEVLIYTNVQELVVSGAYRGPYGVNLLAGSGTGYGSLIAALKGAQWVIYRPSSPVPEWLSVRILAPTQCNGYDLRVYDFFVLSPTAQLESLARSLLQPPYLTPQDIRVTGYVAPTNYLNVDGLGSFEIDTWEYDYTAEKGLLTTARVGRRGSEQQQSQRIAITGLSREWAERLRLSIGRTT